MYTRSQDDRCMRSLTAVVKILLTCDMLYLHISASIVAGLRLLRLEDAPILLGGSVHQDIKTYMLRYNLSKLVLV